MRCAQCDVEFVFYLIVTVENNNRISTLSASYLFNRDRSAFARSQHYVNALICSDKCKFTLNKDSDQFLLILINFFQSITIVQHIEDYLSKHPSIIVIDPLPKVYQLLDRYKCYSIIQKLNPEKFNVFTPNFCEITETDPAKIKLQLQKAKVTYPFICKPIVGHGTLAHDMLIVFNEKSLKDCKPPSVAQSFINHDGILYKIFIVGDAIHVCERPSLKNFRESNEQDTIFFDSTLISKVGGKNSLTVLDPEDQKKNRFVPDLEVLKQVAYVLRKAFGLDLFGVDIVIENTTGKYAVVDVNSFPGSCLFMCCNTVLIKTYFLQVTMDSRIFYLR